MVKQESPNSGCRHDVQIAQKPGIFFNVMYLLPSTHQSMQFGITTKRVTEIYNKCGLFSYVSTVRDCVLEPITKPQIERCNQVC